MSFVPGLGIVKGMALTLRRFFEPKVTVMYPEVRLDVPHKFRGRLQLLYDEWGTLKCETCFQCAQACPIECIDMGGIDTRGRYHVHWGAAETYGERREESALRRSGRVVPDPAYLPFAPVDLAQVDTILEELRPRSRADARHPRGDPVGVRLPAGRGAQADQPRDGRLVRDDLRNRDATTRTSGSSRPRPSSRRRPSTRTDRPNRPISRRSTPRWTGTVAAAHRRGPDMTDLLRTPAEWPTILLARANAKDPTDLDAAVAAGAFEGLAPRHPRARPDRGHRDDRRVGPARSRRRGLPGRRQVADRGLDRCRPALRRRQRLRCRPGVAHGPHADAAGPVRGASRARPSRPTPSARPRRSSPSARRTPMSSRACRPPSAPRPMRASSAPDVSGSGHDIHITVRPVQGAYMLGEETVLLKALEGKRGQPEQRPPHPAEVGPVRPTDPRPQRPDPGDRARGSSAKGADAFTRDRHDRQPGHGPRPGPHARRQERHRRGAAGHAAARRPRARWQAAGRSLGQGRADRRPVGRAAAARCPRHALRLRAAARRGRPPRIRLGRRRRRPHRPARARRRPDPLLLERGLRQVDPVPDRDQAPGRDRGAPRGRASCGRSTRSSPATSRPTSSRPPCATTSAWPPSR